MDNFSEIPLDDSFLGFGKKAKAKRAAKKAARSKGLRGRSVRLAGRRAKLDYKFKKHSNRAGLQRRLAKVGTKAKLVARGEKGRSMRLKARDAKQEVKARQIIKKAASKSGKRKQHLLERAKRVQERDGRTIVGQVAANAILAPLLPFKTAMIKELRNRGLYKSGMKWPRVVNVFYNEVVSKKNNFNSSFDPVDEYFIENHPASKLTIKDYEDSTDSFVGGALAGIVSAIIAFFKKMKAKRLAKKAMTHSEKAMGDSAIKVTKELDKKAALEAPVTKKDLQVAQMGSSTLGSIPIKKVQTINNAKEAKTKGGLGFLSSLGDTLLGQKTNGKRSGGGLLGKFVKNANISVNDGKVKFSSNTNKTPDRLDLERPENSQASLMEGSLVGKLVMSIILVSLGYMAYKKWVS